MTRTLAILALLTLSALSGCSQQFIDQYRANLASAQRQPIPPFAAVPAAPSGTLNLYPTGAAAGVIAYGP